MAESNFSGHRERLRSAFMENGAGAMKDRELLELLLTYAIPRMDVSPHARRLLDTFGSIDRVLCAPPEKLERVSGIGEASAVFLSTVGAAAQRALQRTFEAGDGRIKIESAEDAAAFAISAFMRDGYESFKMASLDGRQRLLGTDTLAGGTLSDVEANPRLVIEKALLRKAAAVLLMHNHPSGDARPSGEDTAIAKKLFALGEELSVTVLDQLIIGRGAVYSMRYERVFVFDGPGSCRCLTVKEYEALLWKC